MRVLHVISSIDPRAGGPSFAIEGLAKAQVALGHDVRVLSTFPPDFNDSIARSLKSHGVLVDLVGPVRRWIEKRRQQIDAVRDCVQWASVVHIHAMWEEIQHLAARIAIETGVPYFIRPCGMLDPWSLQRRKWIKKALLALRIRKNLNSAAGIHYTTEAEKRLATPLGIRSRAIVVPNGVEPAPDAPGSITRESLQIPADAFAFAHLGRIDKKKGIEIAIRALAALRTMRRNVHFVVVGSGDADYVSTLKVLASQLGCTEAVHFLGMQTGSNKYAALRLSNAFVLPSFQENFGNAVAEAMSVGMPVIVSDGVNLCEEVTAAKAGLVFPMEPQSEAPNRLASALASLMNSSTLAAELGTNGREYAEAHFRWSPIAEQWKGIYADVLSRREGNIKSDQEPSQSVRSELL